MSAFYTNLRATATRLIGQYGKTATLTKPGATTGPEWDPTPGTPTDYTVNLVELGYSLTNRDATLIERGDKMLLIEAEVEPVLEDTITVDGGVLRLIDVQPLNPGGTVLLYEAQARV